MTHRWSLQLSIPVGEGRFRRSAPLDPSLSLLVVSVEPKDEQGLAMLSEMIAGIRPNGCRIWVQAMGEFRSLDEIQQVPSASDEVTFHPVPKLVAADGPVGLAFALKEWRAEAHVLFFATEAAARSMVERVEAQTPRWWQYDKNLGEESPFLTQLASRDPVLFFRESHMSIELFCTPEGVLSALHTISGLGIISLGGPRGSSASVA